MAHYLIALNQFPAAEVSLRNASNQMQLISEGELIGYVDKESSFWMTHPGAIYLDLLESGLYAELLASPERLDEFRARTALLDIETAVVDVADFDADATHAYWTEAQNPGRIRRVKLSEN